jgi:arabinogalactan endo-1,4-beta-galactosidase
MRIRLRWAVAAAAVAVLLGASLAWSPAYAGGRGGNCGDTGSLSVRGADISFALREEAAGVRFSDRGRTAPVEQILAGHGADYVRLRIWVDPPAGYSTEADALRLARRARQAGMHILLDLHYSDFWADPGHQTAPAAWASQDLATLTSTVHDYTRHLVADFARQDTPVDMIQVGNEVTDGMLWPLGRIYQADGAHWADFARLMSAGISGARQANPRGHQLKVMVHIDRGGDNGGSVWFYDHLLAEGVTFDVIGESYYPFWHGSLATLQANLNDLATRYGKDIVVVETSYPWTTGNGDPLSNFLTSDDQLPDGTAYPATPPGQAGYFEALRGVLQAVPNGHGLGFFDWEPEWLPGVGWEPGAGNPNDNLTMFDWRGAALPSLSAFRRPAR